MKVLWQPTSAFKDQSNLQQFQHYLHTEKGLAFEGYEDLWKWSTSDLAAFWECIWKYFDVRAETPYKDVIASERMPGTQWFTGSRLNYAEHLFRFENTERTALIFANEKEEIVRIGWKELRHQVQAFRDHLLHVGVQKGDRVAGYLPNVPAAIVAFIATNSLGAIWSCCSMDFGEHTVIERFEQIRPKVFIAADGYYYKTKVFDRTQEIQQIVKSLPTVTAKILLSHLALGDLSDWTAWSEIMDQPNTSDLHFLPVPFDHPIWVLYSSGTTGKPKAITHSHGGVLLEHLKYLSLHNDVRKGEHFFWFTTTGWMMWNFLQASLLVGAVPVLYEGSPGHPDINVLWRLTEQLPIHHFGTSAPYLTALMNLDLDIGDKFDLSNLRSIGSTGAPLPPDAFDYIYEKIAPDIWLCSMSGGTDVCTAFVGGVPSKPVIQGRIQGRALGAALHAYGDAGQRMINQLGEMVIERPMPSMPIYFWEDPKDKRYLQSYFEHYPGKWRHGDYIQIFDDGSLIIQGRSDATLNRKGIRIGTAEIYNVLNDLPELADALVLNLEQDQGDVMPLFVVLDRNASLTDALRNTIQNQLRSECSPRHVPDLIISVPDIPYTLSGKKMEVPVKKLLLGLSDGASLNRDAMRNPDAMEYFVTHCSYFLELFKKASY